MHSRQKVTWSSEEVFKQKKIEIKNTAICRKRSYAASQHLLQKAALPMLHSQKEIDN